MRDFLHEVSLFGTSLFSYKISELDDKTFMDYIMQNPACDKYLQNIHTRSLEL
jgi:hypothetical protein